MFKLFLLHCDLYFRKEELWPALDQLLRDGDDTTVATPYTASVLEYRVVIRDPLDATVDEKKWHNVNGHAVVDAQHPVRCSTAVYYIIWQLVIPNCNLICILTTHAGVMWLCEGSFTLLHQIVLALI